MEQLQRKLSETSSTSSVLLKGRSRLKVGNPKALEIPRKHVTWSDSSGPDEAIMTSADDERSPYLDSSSKSKSPLVLQAPPNRVKEVTQKRIQAALPTTPTMQQVPTIATLGFVGVATGAVDITSKKKVVLPMSALVQLGSTEKLTGVAYEREVTRLRDQSFFSAEQKARMERGFSDGKTAADSLLRPNAKLAWITPTKAAQAQLHIPATSPIQIPYRQTSILPAIQQRSQQLQQPQWAAPYSNNTTMNPYGDSYPAAVKIADMPRGHPSHSLSAQDLRGVQTANLLAPHIKNPAQASPFLPSLSLQALQRQQGRSVSFDTPLRHSLNGPMPVPATKATQAQLRPYLRPVGYLRPNGQGQLSLVPAAQMHGQLSRSGNATHDTWPEGGLLAPNLNVFQIQQTIQPNRQSIEAYSSISADHYSTPQKMQNGPRYPARAAAFSL